MKVCTENRKQMILWDTLILYSLDSFLVGIKNGSAVKVRKKSISLWISETRFSLGKEWIVVCYKHNASRN